MRADYIFPIYREEGGFPMAKYNRNTGKIWSTSDKKSLVNFANQNTPTRVIGLKLGRTEDAVRAKASELDVSLKPTNQSPYNRTH
jgi:hypothetical protein